MSAVQPLPAKGTHTFETTLGGVTIRQRIAMSASGPTSVVTTIAHPGGTVTRVWPAG
jgi:hypothetical protein